MKGNPLQHTNCKFLKPKPEILQWQPLIAHENSSKSTQANAFEQELSPSEFQILTLDTK
jgi:hypothetical protein